MGRLKEQHLETVDTNVIVRFLVGDNQSQQKQAEEWFEEAQKGKRKLHVTPLVIAEVTFVLESNYKLSRERIATALEVLISQRWLQVDNRKELQRLWHWYREGFHFVDSFILAWSLVNNGRSLSFDKKLNNRISNWN